jgi:hypothetical protein
MMLEEFWTSVMAASFWLPVLGQFAGDVTGRVAVSGLQAAASGFALAPACRQRAGRRGLSRLVLVLLDLVVFGDRVRPRRTRRRTTKKTKRRSQGSAKPSGRRRAQTS